jgi:integrase
MADREDPGVFLRGSRFWIGYYHRGEYKRESVKLVTGKNTRVAAKRLLRERLRTAGTAQFIGPQTERVTFEAMASLYMTDFRVNGRRSIVDAERNVRVLAEVFGTDRALDITALRIAAYAEQRLADGMQPASVNRELAALRRMFKLAVMRGLLPTAPVIVLLAEHNVREGFMEPAEFEGVAGTLPPDLVDPARFAYTAGWRKGEVATLEWCDVSLERRGELIVGGTIRLRGANAKNGRPRLLVLDGDLLAIIVRRAAERRLDCPLVFHRDGRPIGDFRKAWRRACASAGVESRRFHDMRRSAVRNLVRAGVPERVAMAMTGHKTRAVFDRYNITSEADLRAAAERVSAYVAERRTEAPTVTPLAPVRRREGR